MVLRDLLDGMRKPPTGTGPGGVRAVRDRQAKRMPGPSAFPVAQDCSDDIVDGIGDALVGRLKLLVRMEKQTSSPCPSWRILKGL